MCLVTGAARGIGAAIADLYASEGAFVVLTDVLDQLGGEKAASIECAQYRQLDVSDEQMWSQVIAEIIECHGQFDILVNNAAVDCTSRLEQTSLKDWQQLVAINQTGVFLGMREAANAWIAAKHEGVIINISSVAGLEATFAHGAYSATKFAVTGLTRTAALEWGRHGIRVNSVHPGVTNTEMIGNIEAFQSEEARQAYLKNFALRRMAEPEDIANMALFLASDEAAYCTGQAYIVDGGMHK